MDAKLLTASRFVNQSTGCSYRYIQSETEYFRPHYHDYFELFIMLSGHAQHFINGETATLVERELVFIRPKDVHNYAGIDNHPFSMLNITFTAETANEIFSFLGEGFASKQLLCDALPPSKILSIADFSALNSKMKAIQAIPEQEIATLKTALRVLIFDALVNHFSVPLNRLTDIPGWLEELCRQMQNGGYIEGSEKLYSLTDKSREHVCRSMKKHMDTTVSEFINELRLNHIANMLQNSNLSITDIIYSSGFNNLSWAAELFKRKHGITMQRYRKESGKPSSTG